MGNVLFFPLAPLTALSSSGLDIHRIFDVKSFGAASNWSEFTTPDAEIVPTDENSFILASIFHNRIEPSQEPRSVLMSGPHQHRSVTYQKQTDPNSVDSLTR